MTEVITVKKFFNYFYCKFAKKNHRIIRLMNKIKLFEVANYPSKNLEFRLKFPKNAIYRENYPNYR